MSVTVIEDTSPLLAWSSPPVYFRDCPLPDWPWCPSGWSYRLDSPDGFTNRSVHSGGLGASVSLAFGGSGVTILGSLDFRDCTPVLVTLDGQPVSVPCVQDGTKIGRRAAIFSRTGLNPAIAHLIDMRPDMTRLPDSPSASTGTRTADGADWTFDLDQLVVCSTGVVRR